LSLRWLERGKTEHEPDARAYIGKDLTILRAGRSYNLRMRRQWAIAALCAALLAIPAWGQRGSFSSGGSSRGSASMGHSSFSNAPAGGFRGSSGFAGTPRVGLQSGQHFHTTFHSGVNNSFRRPFGAPGRFHQRGFLRSYYPFYSYYGYPYDWGYSYSGPDSYPGYDYYSENPSPSDVTAQQQDIDRLEDEVARLREERDAPAAQTKPAAEVASTPTLLVFLDKHTQEVQNYAVVGGTLWIFGEQRATKLPLAWLDVDATIKANDERGVDFRLPN
jgi:hypothetical protein